MEDRKENSKQADFMMDRTTVWKGRIDETPSDFAYWRQQSPEMRLAALESIRREYHGWHDDAPPRLQRVCQITEQT